VSLQAGGFLAKLRELYSFPSDRGQEKDLLSRIVQSIGR
jgi:hypothetical protein